MASSWVIVLDLSEEKVLLGIRRRKSSKAGPGQFNFFGGGIEEGETPVMAAKRELNEELGISVKDRDLVPFTVLKNGGEEFHYFLYARRKFTSESLTRFDKAEISGLYWFRMHSLPKDPKLLKVFHFPTRELLKSKIHTRQLQLVLNRLGGGRGSKHSQETTAKSISNEVNLQEVVEAFQPYWDVANQQAKDLQAELAWAYRSLDQVQPDWESVYSSMITDYRSAVAAAERISPIWFAELPVSYDRMRRIAGILKADFSVYLHEDSCPSVIKEILQEDFSSVVKYRGNMEKMDNFEDLVENDLVEKGEENA